MHDVRSVQGPALDAYIISRYDEHMVNKNDLICDAFLGAKIFLMT